jgi:hypothetical protein
MIWLVQRESDCLTLGSVFWGTNYMNAIRTALIPLGLAIGLGAAPAFADVIAVNNASFETLPTSGPAPTTCGAGCDYTQGNPIPGWVSTPTNGNWGQFQPGPAPNAYFNYLDDGTTSAYANNGVLSQTVTTTVIAGMTYTLMVDVGFRKDLAAPGSVMLDIGSGPSTIQVLATGSNPGAGNWATFTATFTATAADVGDALTIVLSSLSAQGDWDNVRLSDSPTSSTTSDSLPEPGSAAILASALLGLGAWRMRGRAL